MLLHLRSVWYVLLLWQEPWPQGGREALWERVTVLACHNQMKGCAELWERESTVSVDITQLPNKKKIGKKKQILIP